jgi:hypothetical protein
MKETHYLRVVTGHPTHKALLDQQVEENGQHVRQNQRLSDQAPHFADHWQKLRVSLLQLLLVKSRHCRQRNHDHHQSGDQKIDVQPAGGRCVERIEECTDEKVARDNAQHEECLEKVHQTDMRILRPRNQANHAKHGHFDHGKRRANHGKEHKRHRQTRQQRGHNARHGNCGEPSQETALVADLGQVRPRQQRHRG